MKEKTTEIPVVDFAKIGLDAKDGEIAEEDLKDVANQLHSAFTSCGFVYLRGHGFPMSLMDEVMEESKRFFESHTVEEKEKAFPWDQVEMVGYNGPNSENLEVLAEDREANGNDAPLSYELRETLETTSVAADSRFPDELAPKLRGLFKQLRDHLVPLTLRILKAISVSLNLDQDHFPKLHQLMLQDRNRSDLRTLYYPAIKGEVTPGLTRCGDHFDYGTVTLLFQDSLGGLEVKDVGDGWIRAPPIKDCILVNLGEEMEIFTNGVYPATRHRVVVPEEEVVRRQPRQSFAFFVNVDDHVMLEPIKGEEPKSDRYKPVNSRVHMDRLLDATYAGS